jgi:hypothetical protein
VFFKYGEVNNFWMQRDWIEEKISICYDPDSEYMTNDISWVCSLFAVLAIGTQMAHMEEDKSAPSLNAVDETPTCSEDSVGLVLYRVACKLIPDVILAASQESAQAFLLLAAYGLPVSTGGLSYTYFGLALKMAIQNGMHRKCSDVECDSRTNEFRNRLFWSIYTLERYVFFPNTLIKKHTNKCPVELASCMGGLFQSLGRTLVQTYPKRILRSNRLTFPT